MNLRSKRVNCPRHEDRILIHNMLLQASQPIVAHLFTSDIKRDRYCYVFYSNVREGWMRGTVRGVEQISIREFIHELKKIDNKM